MKLDFDELRPTLGAQLKASTLDKLVDELCLIRSGCINEAARGDISIIKNENNNSDIIVAHQLLLLAHLIPPPAKVTRNWKPSVPECQDSLILLAAVKTYFFPLV